MKLLLIILIIFPFVYTEISDCTPSESPVKLLKFQISPDPLEVGKEANISMTFITEKQIDEGDIDITAYIRVGNNWIPMPKLNMKLCEVSDCPIEKGKHSVKKSFTIPGVVPKGEYKGIININDQNENLLICLNFQLELK